MPQPALSHQPSDTPPTAAFELGEGATPAVAMALIPALRDNYVPVLHNGRQAAVVDPAEAGPVIRWLQLHGLELVAVLQTHHHADHIGGTPELQQRWPDAAVVAAAADRQRIPFQTHPVEGGDQFRLLGRWATVVAVPGHTRAHLAYYLAPLDGRPGEATGPAAAPAWDGIAHAVDPLPGWGELFCGDTLFLAGCGRLFEGSPSQMHTSLQRLADLPDATRIWCAHEYTETNLRWACNQRPRDGALSGRLHSVRSQRTRGLPTVPGSLQEERRTNLFLRAGDAEELAELRRSRNDWTG